MNIDDIVKTAERLTELGSQSSTPVYGVREINDAFDISLKAKALHDEGLLHSGTEVMTQAAQLGEFMWEALWRQATKNAQLKEKVEKPGLDRGEPLIVK